MKELIRDKHKLKKLEENQKMIDTKFEKRIFQLELKFHLYGLTEEFDNSKGKKKKRSKKHLSEVKAMVEALVNENMPEFSQQRRNRPMLPRKKNSVAVSNQQTSNPDAKNGLRQHLYKKMSTGGQTQNGSPSNKRVYVTEQSRHEIRYQTPQLLGNTSNSHLGKSNPRKVNSQQHVLAKDESVQLGLKEGEEVIELSPEQCNILLELFDSHGNEPVLNISSAPQPDVSAKQECLSPVTSTGNMLERLLRRSEKSSDESLDCSELEESTESTTGMR